MAASEARSTADVAVTRESQARQTAVAAQGEAEAAAIAADEARGAAETNANQATAAEATAQSSRDLAMAAHEQVGQQRQVMSLMSQSQSLMNVRGPDNQAIAQARLMAVAAAQMEQDVTGGQDSGVLTSWNTYLSQYLTAPYQPLTSLTEQMGTINDIAWSRDSSRLASASCEGVDESGFSCTQNEMIIWEADGWQPVTTLVEHTDWIWKVSWNSDGHLLASASADNRIIIWDTLNWQPLTILTEHTNWVNDIAWNEDSRRLASASDDGRVII